MATLPRERRDGGGSNLASSSHPSSPSPVSPPIVLVKLWADTSVLPILFQLSTHLIFVINFTFVVGLIKTSHALFVPLELAVNVLNGVCQSVCLSEI